MFWYVRRETAPEVAEVLLLPEIADGCGFGQPDVRKFHRDVNDALLSVKEADGLAAIRHGRVR